MKKDYAHVLFIILLASFFVFRTGDVKAQIIKTTTADLTNESDNIIRGTVNDLKSEWNDEKTFIWTFVTVKVAETIKGRSLKDQNIVIKIPGGEVGEIGQRDEHQVIFKKNEEVILFLKPETYKQREYFQVTRLSQGKFTIREGKIVERKFDVGAFVVEIKRAMKKK